VAVWSHYSGAGPSMRFMRVGTLDDPGRFPPDVHIFTSTRQPWFELPAGAPAFSEYYNPREVWSPESQARYKAAKASLAPSR